MLNVALLCTNASPTLRPTMSQVVSMLEGRTAVQDLLSDPGFSAINSKYKAIRNHFWQNTSRTHSLSINGSCTDTSNSYIEIEEAGQLLRSSSVKSNQYMPVSECQLFMAHGGKSPSVYAPSLLQLISSKQVYFKCIFNKARFCVSPSVTYYKPRGCKQNVKAILVTITYFLGSAIVFYTGLNKIMTFFLGLAKMFRYMAEQIRLRDSPSLQVGWLRFCAWV